MRYHVIIVGAGHAGCEAAVSLAKRNIQTVLITGNLKNMASLPCNPSIGGPAKGILVREIDALGGIMGTMADKCQIQIKMLNSGNGEAVRALRAQIDKQYYPRLMKRKLKKYKCLTLLEGLVDKLTIVNGEVRGVVLADGTNIDSKYVLLSTGTYLNSRCLTGNEEKISGPDNEPTTFGLSEQLKELGFEVIRLKTGTPPRILTKSIDFSKAEIQPGDKKIDYFSHYAWKGFGRGNLPCYLTRTNELTHQVILENLDKSAMYGGLINGKGPRYCPSIEDKV
ncbi:MAG: tRNA uridine-5-carboxymethylaminomethyl(34) synthesis enzyme MnmG, partial [Acholeplasmatales bacterium]|nr:tRNA uridine-5-carboxymethylaminomethyl(34) synthesis enzyme MnmG [Acholeplasmatales bacterium]